MTRGTFRGLFSSILLPFPLLFLSLLYSLAIGISHTHVVSGSIVVTMLNAALLISVFHYFYSSSSLHRARFCDALISHILLNAEFVKKKNARDVMIRKSHKPEALRCVSRLPIQR